jgi:DNA polymerase-3 subunit epsilon
VAVDVETNGRGGEACELTEVGAVLVGGGEMHDRFESLVQVQLPLSRGIERFTGISQAMVDDAPPPEEVLPRIAELLKGRVLVAHNASFDNRVLRQAFDRAGLKWPRPPVVCTINMARKLSPLTRERKLAPLATALGIEVDVIHRALPDAELCARIFCALFPRMCATAKTLEDALTLLQPRRRGNKDQRPTANGLRPPEGLKDLPNDPGVYIFRDTAGTPLYVGKSVAVRSRARAHFLAPPGWSEHAEIVDYRPTNSELGALVLENRLIKAWQPTGNKALKRTDGHVFLRCRLDIAYPVLEVAPDPAPGHAVNVGPLRGREAAVDLADQLTSLFRLRHCGRTMKLREHPSMYGQMGRCASPCLGDLDPNAYRRQIDKALAIFESRDARAQVIALIEEQMRDAARNRLFERAAVLRNRRERMERVLDRLDGVLEATHSRPRLVLARHPAKPWFDAFWIVGGRVADWGPLPEPEEIDARTEAALTKRRRDPVVPAEEIDELRIVAGWIARKEPPVLDLEEGCRPSGWVKNVKRGRPAAGQRIEIGLEHRIGA